MKKHGLKNSKERLWKIQAKKEQENAADIIMYGPIASEVWWGDEITPKEFKKELDALGDSIDTLNIYINSPGGDVFAGQAIYSMLKRHKAAKNTYVDGLAASIASVIFESGDVRRSPNNGMIMIHKCWTLVVGNADDMRKMAGDMDKIDESIIGVYDERASISREKIIELVKAETWMTAEEALEYGFIDEIEQTNTVAASIDNNVLVINGVAVDLDEFKNFSFDKFNLNTPKPQKTQKPSNTGKPSAGKFQGGGNMNENCVCNSCNHSDNCQSSGAKCCICGNCEMADQCSKPGAEGCSCKDCTMAQNNCCQTGSESCMCDTCTNIDCKKGHAGDGMSSKNQLLALRRKQLENKAKEII